MPECKLSLNDKLLAANEEKEPAATPDAQGGKPKFQPIKYVESVYITGL
jgi:hypothetical protein